MTRILILPLLAAAALAQPQSATEPLILEGNVPMVDLTFTRPDGSTCKGRFVVDTGGGSFLMSAKLAKEAGIPAVGPSMKAEGSEFAPIKPKGVRLGALPLDLEGLRALMVIGEDFDPRDAVQGLIPGVLLKRYHVIFDYPAHQFTLAAPGSVKPRGTRIDSPYLEKNGHPRIEATINGVKYGFLLDTGASFTMISRKAMDGWAAGDGAKWPRHTGAVGAANMSGSPMDTAGLMLRVPTIELAGFTLNGVGITSRTEGIFEKSMSNNMTGPVIGAIGSNVWRQFRVEIDYAGKATYLERTGADSPTDLDLVGLSFRPGKDSLVVAAVSEAAAPGVRSAVEPGDQLRSIDGVAASGFSMMQAVDRLRGKPGDEKVLEFERAGKKFTVRAAVTRLM
jgi:predicted aspartyl protease